MNNFRYEDYPRCAISRLRLSHLKLLILLKLFNMLLIIYY
jgi:hypothetical protein